MPAAPSLFRPEAYAAQLERLRVKARSHGGRSPPPSEGLTLPELRHGATALCQAIANDVRRGQFRLSPLRRSELVVDGKRRILHRPELLDALVLGAISARLTGLFESLLSDAVYAYRPGRSARLAVERLARLLHDHRRRVPQKQRGLFVLQRDLSAYGESIPTGPDSALWPLLERALRGLPDANERGVLRELTKAACCPTVLSADGALVLGRGLPTGSPVQQPLQNLYLVPLDERLSERSLFYARFGDDLFLAGADQAAAEAAAADLDAGVADLGLRFNANKSRNLYFTKPGRPCTSESRLVFSPTSHVEYLGKRIDFDGRLGFSRKRLRQLLQRSRVRIDNTLALASKETALASVAAGLCRALGGDDGLADPAVEALRTWVDDRKQLRQLDAQLALMCAEALAGVRGVKAFRHTRVKELRAAGLSSLLELRRRSRSTR